VSGTNGRRGSGRGRLVGVLLLAAVLAAIALRFRARGPTDDAGEDSASREFTLLYGAQLTADPAWQEVLRTAHSPAEAQEAVRQLTARGVVRLDDATLRARAGILRTLLASDPALCAAVARGQATTATLAPAVMRLDTATRRTWYDVGAKAILAELHRTPPPAADADATEEAFRTLLGRLPPEQRTRLRDVTAHAAGASDADACAALRTLYDGAAELPDAQGTLVLRALARAS